MQYNGEQDYNGVYGGWRTDTEAGVYEDRTSVRGSNYRTHGAYVGDAAASGVYADNPSTPAQTSSLQLGPTNTHVLYVV